MTCYLQPPPSNQLILASQSPRRKHLLAEAGIFADKIIAADIDETSLKNERPADYVLRMAREKRILLLASNVVISFYLRIQLLHVDGKFYQRLKL